MVTEEEFDYVRYLYILLVYEKKELKELDRQELLIVVLWNRESKKEVELCNDLISYLNERSVNGQRNECGS